MTANRGSVLQPRPPFRMSAAMTPQTRVDSSVPNDRPGVPCRMIAGTVVRLDASEVRI